jgi:isochorismate synthase
MRAFATHEGEERSRGEGWEARLEEHFTGTAAEATVVVHLPAPLVDPEALLRLRPELTGVFFAPPGEPSVCGLGAAVTLSPQGPERGFLVERAAARLAHVKEISLGTAGAPSVRFLGAMPFMPAASSESVWTAGLLVLPRWRYARTAEEAWFSVTATPELRSSAGLRRSLIAETRRLLARLPESGVGSAPRVVRSDEGDTAGYLAGVAAAVAAIREGRLEKVVLARAARVDLEDEVEVADLLARLQREAGWGAGFALRVDGGAFFGLSPERLVRRAGRQVSSEALAGTAATGDAATLEASAKDAAEHAVVVTAIVETLRPFCSEMRVADHAGVRALRHVLHLHTPIEGELRAPAHVLALVDALHPTPATNGVPRVASREWIRDHEPTPRGLYAGPFGWFDAAGDGDFWVGLRSALVDGREVRVWGGAGIVEGSDPAAELHETQLKQRGLRQVLGERG